MSMSAHLNPGTLYCLATPIGNLDDATPRSRKVLEEVSIIACEDTRTAGRLLSHFGIQSPRLISYYEHNEERRAEELVSLLLKGNSIALLSEAGTPTVSDPGYRLVNRCAEMGIPVVPIPGVSAVIAALSAAGLPTDRFLFLGFPPRKGSKLRQFLMWVTLPGLTTVVYLPARRLVEFLREVGNLSNEVRVVVGREMTKFHEEFLRGSPLELAEEIEAHPRKGECTLVFHTVGKIKRKPLEAFWTQVTGMEISPENGED